MRLRAFRRRALLVAALAGIHVASTSVPAFSDPSGWEADAPRRMPWFETWTGASATQHAWSLYAGLTVAPFGDIRKSGFRLRTVAGYGRYRYDGNLLINRQVVPTVFRGTVTFAELLAGYQVRWGPLTSKVFAGYYAELHVISPYDPRSHSHGRAEGIKLALENWLDFGGRWWASLDGSWTSANTSYWTRMRAAYRVWPKLSAGLETGALGNVEFDAGRLGAFLRYETDNGELSASGGVSGDYGAPTNAYVSLNWLSRY